MFGKLGLVLSICAVVPVLGCASEGDTASADQMATGAKPPASGSEAAAAISWEGQWKASLDGGKTAGGSAIFIEYAITVHGDEVTVSADGFQTSTRMNGTGKVKGNDLVVTFTSCGADDQFQCNSVKAGETLLRLHGEAGKFKVLFDKLPAEQKELPLTRASESLWAGSWKAAFDGGQTAGGSTVFIEYAIVVDGDKVTVAADGFQTSTRMNGTGKVEGKNLVVSFDTCGEDDQFQCSSVKKGDVLFRLQRDGQRSKIVFDKLLAEREELPLSHKQ